MGFELTRGAKVVRARLSWVRAAYPVAFAALGWRYVCMPYLAPLRAQLADPDATLLPPLARFLTQARYRTVATLLWFKSPMSCAASPSCSAAIPFFFPGSRTRSHLCPSRLRSADLPCS